MNSERLEIDPPVLTFQWRKREDRDPLAPPDGGTKTKAQGPFFLFLAEARGFEPPRRLTRPHDFESCAFNHSATLPPIIIP